MNLFPVKLDLKPFIDAWGSAATFKISAPDGSLHFCGVDVAPSAAGAIQTNDVYTTTGDPLYAADFVEMPQGEAQIAPADYLGNDNEPGVLAFEAVEAYGKPKLSVMLGNMEVLEFELPLSLSSVRDMYRWRNLRPVCGGSYADWDALGEPSNLPDGETDGKDIFFLHGFNVSESAARNWANQMFKRLWLSGSRARFHGVAWYGDYHLVSGTFNGLHYHQDVYHALQTAHAFKLYAEAVQGSASSRIVMAHSLGNMVASEALRQGLQVGRYFMFNAAVASEAFDGTLQAEAPQDESYMKYVPSDWHGYTNMCWAANWHRWFGANDARSDMGWPDRFASALNNSGTVCNYYSSGDEIFEEMPSTPSVLSGVFHWPTLQPSWPFVDLSSMFTPSVNPWQKQEVLKGVDSVAGTLAGGWGFHYISNSTPSVTTWRIYTPEEARAMVEDGLIVTNAVFARNVPAMFNPSATQDAQFETIAKYTPSVSSATGKIPVFKQDDITYDMNASGCRSGWGRNHPQYGTDWLHSDMKDMAYRYVFPLYAIINEVIQ